MYYNYCRVETQKIKIFRYPLNSHKTAHDVTRRIILRCRTRFPPHTAKPHNNNILHHSSDSDIVVPSPPPHLRPYISLAIAATRRFSTLDTRRREQHKARIFCVAASFQTVLFTIEKRFERVAGRKKENRLKK